MKKKILSLLPLITLIIAGCRTSFDTSSTTTSDTSSEEVSSIENSSENISSSEVQTSSEAAPSSEAISSSDVVSTSEAAPSSETGISSQDVSSSEIKDSSSEQSSEVTTSSEKMDSSQESGQSSESQVSSEEQSSEVITSSEAQSSEEQSSETKSDLQKMNEALSGKTFIDPFEVRDYLLEEGYPFNDTLSDGSKYGYNTSFERVVRFKNHEILEPAEYVTGNLFEYKTYEVNSWTTLANVVDFLNNGTASYDVIKLTANIAQPDATQLIQIKYAKPLEIDLNGKTISAPVEKVINAANEKWYTIQILDNTGKGQYYIHGGKIEANRKMKADGIEDDACCLSLASGKSFRLDNLTLKAINGTQCIGDLSQYVTNHNDQFKKVYISNVKMDAPLRAMSIAGGEWNIKDCNEINAMVVIDGGTVNINNCVINASNALVAGLNDYEERFTNEQLAVKLVPILNGQPYSGTVSDVLKGYFGAVTFNDAILVTSRRSSYYTPSVVSVTNSTLTPVMNGTIMTGFGIRYWDLAGYTSSDAVNPICVNSGSNNHGF